MLHGESLGLLVGAVALGAVHGIEPGHGWPVAASYALDRSNKWLYGFAASSIIGIGHLVSSIAMVGVFFYAKAYFDLTQANEPIQILGGLEIGGPISLVAGLLLIGLGVREYRHGHSHGGHDHGGDGGNEGDAGHAHNHVDNGHAHDGGHEHAHDDHDHAHDGGHDHSEDHHGHDDSAAGGIFARLKGFLPFVGGHSHAHGGEAAADRGLLGIAWFAFVLGFAHEEEFEIIALCAGSTHCLELMAAYALTVIVGIVALTMLLIAGYEHYEERVERYTPYLPVFSAVVLIVMGVGFITGLL
jgi:ABC-type nickel/cobalt efflux system permease component RcnA